MAKKNSRRQAKNQNALESARALAGEFGYIPVMTAFILDTGAGVHLKCFAKDLPLREMQEIYMHSANGPITSNKITNVEFRNIENSDCVVLVLKIPLEFLVLEF